MTTMRPPFQLTLDLPILAGVKPRVRPCERSKWPRRCPNPKARHPRVLNPPNRRGTDPYARWCGRGGVVRRPPIPIYSGLPSSHNRHRGLIEWQAPHSSRGGRPFYVKVHGRVLHAMSWDWIAAVPHGVASGPLASVACIARDVIPRVRPPICCVQYGVSITDPASSTSCTP